jgi:phenylalanyl-tRNA synthetase beta chain
VEAGRPGLRWRLPEGWGSGARKVDFYDVKGDLEALLAPACCVSRNCSHPALHPGRCARILLDGKDIGCPWRTASGMGAEIRSAAGAGGFSNSISIAQGASVPAYAEVSKFPPVIRDLAIVVDQEVLCRPCWMA